MTSRNTLEIGLIFFEHFRIFATTWHALLYLPRIPRTLSRDEFFAHSHAKLRAMAYVPV